MTLKVVKDKSQHLEGNLHYANVDGMVIQGHQHSTKCDCLVHHWPRAIPKPLTTYAGFTRKTTQVHCQGL